MKQTITFFLIFFLACGCCFSQSINFTDLELKRYLIQELCVDSSNTGAFFSNDLDVDLNNDNEIQLSEAEQVLRLEIYDLQDEYGIKSLLDLNAFKNLRYLKILHNDSIVSLSNFALDSLKTLWIGNCINLRVVDISNLTGLSDDFRVEDLDTLDYLNIQNGSIPQYFSLFYTDNLRYACVDSIAAEYNEVAWKMISGSPTIANCTSVNGNKPEAPAALLKVFPNPTQGSISIESHLQFDRVAVFDSKGRYRDTLTIHGGIIDLSAFPSGVYCLLFSSEDQVICKKIVKR